MEKECSSKVKLPLCRAANKWGFGVCNLVNNWKNVLNYYRGCKLLRLLGGVRECIREPVRCWQDS